MTAIWLPSLPSPTKPRVLPLTVPARAVCQRPDRRPFSAWTNPLLRDKIWAQASSTVEATGCSAERVPIIDEGFGTQDSSGLEKLKEAINSIQDDFEKVLVITHMDELKDAFPTRIDVVKSGAGSVITVS